MGILRSAKKCLYYFLRAGVLILRYRDIMLRKSVSKKQARETLKLNFREKLAQHLSSFSRAIATDNGDWVVKGFIDVAKNIYTISADTKVVSKIIELLIFPKICQFAEEEKYKIVLCREQNHYPDVTFVDENGNKFAVDLKSTYRTAPDEINGMTLGAFTGYFRQRNSQRNITFPYSSYAGHFSLGVIYSRSDESIDERKIYSLEQLKDVPSVLKDFQFFIQEKYKIASDGPGSGNTKNIGSLKKISKIIEGQGPFAGLGEEIFDDYWMYYLTADMARAVDLPKAPYRNLKEYHEYKSKRN
jgi:hypothetical protein